MDAAEELYERISRLAALLRAEARESGLQPVQLQALAYLDRCNRYSDTPAAVAEYLEATRGTTSQTLRALEREGLVARRPDADDRRVSHLRPTARGRRLLRRHAPPALLREAVRALGGPAVEALNDRLRDLLLSLQRAHGGRAFGVCQSCRHFRREAGGFRCGLTGEALSQDDSLRLCREHERPAGEAADAAPE